MIGWLTGLAQRAIASGERVYELLDAPLEMEERPDAAPLPQATGAVTFDDVSFSYVDRPVLEDVDLEVPAGAPSRSSATPGAARPRSPTSCRASTT